MPSQQRAPGSAARCPGLTKAETLNLTFPHALGSSAAAPGRAGHAGAPPPLGLSHVGCCCFSGDTPLSTDYRRWV